MFSTVFFENRLTASRLLLCCLFLQVAACAYVPQGATVNLDIPFITTRGLRVDDNGLPRYSTDVAAISGGHCRVGLIEGEELEASNLPPETLSVEELMTGLALRAQEGLLVYVHGYNTGLERACRDAARLAYRTGFERRILLLSWPASRTVVTYWKDERRLTESMPLILQTMDDLGTRYGYDNINIVAHSMGSRLVLESIQAPPQNQRFDDLILIAPDIGRAVFIDALPALQARVRSVSVIASESDRLLMFSQAVNLGERLGQASDFVAAGVEVVDVSDFENRGFGGHLYHLESDRVGEILKRILITTPTDIDDDGDGSQ
jgi:esterase/lipase superfamily enzyme